MKTLSDIQLFLLDMDGTIYHENELIPGALEFFEFLNSKSLPYVFMTNNSSKGKNDYIKKLHKLGIVVEGKNIVSSVNVTIDFIKDRGFSESNIFVVGTNSFKDELKENGFNIFDENDNLPDIDLAILGFDTELNYKKIQTLCKILSTGCEYVATNCDLKCPVKGGLFIPDCGAMARMIAEATGRMPKFLGKPEKEIVLSAAKRFNVDVDKVLCIGDRLYTDIAVGINSGSPTAVVLTGETKSEDLIKSEYKPTYCFESIANLYDQLKVNVL